MSYRVLPPACGESCAALRIRALMTEPVVYNGDGLPLDGILSAAAFSALPERTRRRMPPLTSDFPHDVKLPLARWAVDVGSQWSGERRLLRKGTSELWGWCASFVRADWVKHHQIEMRKRPDIEAVKRYTAESSVDIGAGPLKAYDLAFPTSFARELVWFALGDLNAVESLLYRIIAIGKKRHTGNGMVERWIVEPHEADESIVDADRRLARRMPVESGLDGRPSRMAIRPAYHHHSRVVDCVEPAP